VLLSVLLYLNQQDAELSKMAHGESAATATLSVELMDQQL